MRRTIIPGVIPNDQPLNFLDPQATARDAARVMHERRVAAVMVMEGGRLIGIVTERDLVFKVMAQAGDPDTTTLVEIMTTRPETLHPSDSVLDALDKMQAGRYRHLPVVDGERVCGMVSIRDIFTACRRALEEDLQTAESLIHGEQYGATAHA